jgi:adenine-specific DNA-methyltransferase
MQSENEDFLTKQLITYIGNKRALLPFIAEGVDHVRNKLHKSKLSIFDVFSGSGVVSRLFKRYASLLLSNDMERYTKVINECYLANRSAADIDKLTNIYDTLMERIENNELRENIIAKLYAPKDDDAITGNERVFFTKRNAMYIDTMRGQIGALAPEYQKYFLAPLLSEASIHSNTAGVFKGFYKNRTTGAGQFGGAGQDALGRIKGEIRLPFPVFSNFDCDVLVYNDDANTLVKTIDEVDLAYLDPPYNQHPYGSNYFMLNVIADYEYPQNISRVSGIPSDWKRSVFNKKRFTLRALQSLIENLKAKYVLLSFNSEGFIPLEQMKAMLKKMGRLEVFETQYNTFRACRNLKNRPVHVKEYLYLLEK